MRCRAWQGVLEGSGDLVTRVINKSAIVTDFFAPTKELRILLTRSHDPAKYVLGIRVSEVHHPLVAMHSTERRQYRVCGSSSRAVNPHPLQKDPFTPKP